MARAKESPGGGGAENGHDTEMDVSPIDIHRELDAFRRLHEVEGRFMVKPVKRKYAFEVEGVPQGEHEWYKAVYGFDRGWRGW